MWKYKTTEIISGQQRSGKTFYTKKVAKVMHQKGAIPFVYNIGNLDDFPDYEEIEILNVLETSEYLEFELYKDKQEIRRFNRYPKIEYFRYQGEIYHLSRFNFILQGKKVYSYRIDAKNEDLLFAAIFKYISNTYLIIDDARVILRHGMQANLINLFARRDHTGYLCSIPALRKKENRGIDIACIFHDMDLINDEMLRYTTAFVIYPGIVEPELKALRNREVKELLIKAYRELSEAKKRPDYFHDGYRVTIRSNSGRYLISKIEGRKIEKI